MKTSKPAIVRIAAVLLMLTAVLSLSSCLDVETSIRLGRHGAAEARIEYRMTAETAGFGRGFGADEPWPFPLTEKDFVQQSLRFPDTEVKRYRKGSDSDGNEWVRVDLRSDSLESLAEYLGLDITVRTDAEGGRMELRLPAAPSWDAAGNDLAAALGPMAEETSFLFRFRPPAKPVDAGVGTVDGRSAVYEITLAELLGNGAPAAWTVAW